MYFVDREKMEEILNYMEKVMEELSKHSYHSFADKLLLERLIHVSIESILDVGNMMIDGFIMRDPGSYDDIIDILTDERVLPEEEQQGYKEFVRLRKSVVQQYPTINHDHLLAVWNKEKSSLKQFPTKVRTYLDQELGPVSAFSRKDK